MEISTFCMAKPLRRFELLSPHLALCISHAAITSATRTNAQIGVACYVFFITFLLTYIYLTTGSHLWIHFYLHCSNFTLFSFCPQSISTVFCFVFVHLITEFELDLYHISIMRSQVRVLHFCSFSVLLASILARSRVYIIKSKEDHQLPPFTFIPAF